MSGDVEPAIGGGGRLDKHIPIALIVTLVIAFAGQTGGIVWWAATFSATTNTRLSALENERSAERDRRELDRQAAARRDLSIRTLETQIPEMAVKIDRIDQKLDKLIDRELENKP